MSSTKRKTTNSKKAYIIIPISVILTAAIIIGIIFLVKSCSEEDEDFVYVNKSELGLNFVIPDSFKRTYDYALDGIDIEYSGEEIAFFVDLIPYTEYEENYGVTSESSIKECTDAIMKAMSFEDMNIRYTDSTAQFDVWTTDEVGSASFYNYITVLLSQNGIYVARYVCVGADEAIEKYSPIFAEMSSYLSVASPKM